MPTNAKQLPQVFLALLSLVVVASLYLRFQFDFNAGHMDEYDYLFVGKRLLAGETWPSYTYIFGSDFNWYLLGWGDRWLGDLNGARMIAGVFGLLSLAGLYWFVYCLWKRHLTACIAVVLLSIQSIQLFISRFATYDIISFACFCLALAPLFLACSTTQRKRYLYLLISIVFMSLAITSKYVVILYLPVIAGLAFFYSRWIGFIFGSIMGVVLLVYLAVHWESLQILYRVQIQGVHGAGNGSVKYITETFLNYLGPLAIAWLLALLWSIRMNPRSFWQQSSFKQLLLLLLLALPMAAYHFNALNMISLYKHLVYAVLFLVPAMAWLLTNFLESQRLSGLKQGVACSFVIGLCMVNYQQLKQMEAAYADVSPIIEKVGSDLQKEDTILSEDPYLFRYLGNETIAQSRIKESGWLDNDLDGKYESQDVIDAVWDMKFTYVYLNDQLHPELNKKLRGILKLKKYKRLVNKAYKVSDVMSRQVTGEISLYQRVQTPHLSLMKDALFTSDQNIGDHDKEKSHGN